ncbi:hypothetical protein D3C87_1463030 [compost metagenome]
MQRRAAARGINPGAQEIAESLRGGQDGPVGAYDPHRIEAFRLLLHARDFGGKPLRRVDQFRHVAGAVAQLLLRRFQETARAFRQLGGIDPVRLQRVRDQLLALHAIAGVQRVRRGGDGAENGKREH